MYRYFICLLTLVAIKLSAQNYTLPQGASSVGIGNASVTTANTWSVFNNQASLSEVKEINAAFSFEMMQQMPSLKTLGFAATLPVSKNGTAGLKIFRSGNEIYNEQTAGLAFGHKIGNVSLGISADILQLNITNFDTKRAAIISFGGLVQLSSTLFLGAHIYNLNLAKMASYQDERVPTIMKAGLSYRPFEKLMVNGEIVKDIYTNPDLRFGIQYKIIDKMPVRFGVNTLTKSFSVGTGFTMRDISLDYALNSRQIYGVMHTLTLNYQLRNKKKNLKDEAQK